MKLMFKNCGKNYVNCLKFTFTVLGILFLSLLLAGSAFWAKTVISVTQLKADVIANYEEADLKLTYLTDAVKNKIATFGLRDVLRIIEAKSILPALEGGIENALRLIIRNYEDFAEDVMVSVEAFVNNIYVAIAFFLIVFVLGMIVSFFVTEICVRRRLAKERFLRILKETALRLAGVALSVLAVYGLYQALPDYYEFVICLLPVLLVFFAMLATWVSSIGKGFRFGEIVNFKNFFTLLVSDLAMLALTALIAYLIYLITNIVVAAVMAAALVIVMLAALDLSSVTCVVGLEAVQEAEAAASEQDQISAATQEAIAENKEEENK